MTEEPWACTKNRLEAPPSRPAQPLHPEKSPGSCCFGHNSEVHFRCCEGGAALSSERGEDGPNSGGRFEVYCGWFDFFGWKAARRKPSSRWLDSRRRQSSVTGIIARAAARKSSTRRRLFSDPRLRFLCCAARRRDAISLEEFPCFGFLNLFFDHGP